MKTTDYFKATIQNYLEQRAQTDELFAPVFANPKKNIDECITYILNTVQKSGINGFTDDEIYSMALHYYDEEDIEVGKDIFGKKIIVTDLDAAIEQLEGFDETPCPYKMEESDITVGGYHTDVLRKLLAIRQEHRRANWRPSTTERYEAGKRLNKIDMGFEIGRIDPYHPANLYWDTLKRDEIVRFFNDIFGTVIQ